MAIIHPPGQLPRRRHGPDRNLARPVVIWPWWRGRYVAWFYFLQIHGPRQNLSHARPPDHVQGLREWQTRKMRRWLLRGAGRALTPHSPSSVNGSRWVSATTLGAITFCFEFSSSVCFVLSLLLGLVDFCMKHRRWPCAPPLRLHGLLCGREHDMILERFVSMDYLPRRPSASQVVGSHLVQ